MHLGVGIHVGAQFSPNDVVWQPTNAGEEVVDVGVREQICRCGCRDTGRNACQVRRRAVRRRRRLRGGGFGRRNRGVGGQRRYAIAAAANIAVCPLRLLREPPRSVPPSGTCGPAAGVSTRIGQSHRKRIARNSERKACPQWSCCSGLASPPCWASRSVSNANGDPEWPVCKPWRWSAWSRRCS